MFIAIMYENGYHGPMLTDQGGKKASWQNCIYSSAYFVLAKPVRINPALTFLKLKYSLPAPPKHFLRIAPGDKQNYSLLESRAEPPLNEFVLRLSE